MSDSDDIEIKTLREHNRKLAGERGDLRVQVGELQDALAVVRAQNQELLREVAELRQSLGDVYDAQNG